jgi:hypothetical protein
MNEPRVQNIHRQLMMIMQNDGDHCSICKKEFVDRNIYGGVTVSGAVELVGECCVHHLKIFCGGVVVCFSLGEFSRT